MTLPRLQRGAMYHFDSLAQRAQQREALVFVRYAGLRAQLHPVRQRNRCHPVLRENQVRPLRRRWRAPRA